MAPNGEVGFDMQYNLSYVKPSQRKVLQLAASRSCYIDKPLGCPCYEDAFVLPHEDALVAGVATSSGAFIPSTGLDGNEQRTFDRKNYVRRDIDAIYMGCFHWVWGHYLTDNIKRFWFLYTKECKLLLEQGALLVFTCVCNKDITDNGRLIFGMADVDASQLHLVKEPTQFRRLYVPDSSFVHSELTKDSSGERYFTKEYVQTIERIKQKIESSVIKDKIYFSRTGLNSNFLRETGEWEIERVFRKKGYEIIRPETLPLKDQLSLLANCTHFAATEGSIAHNAIFCKPHTSVEIIRKADYVNYYQLVINEVADLDVTYIDAHHTTPPYGDNHVWFGPFYMCVTSYLKRWSQLNICYVPYFFKATYWWYQLRRTSFIAKWIANRNIVHRWELLYWSKCANNSQREL